ncbi:MAG: acyl-CoA dehydratase activase [candidate division FCPU426 bacterium]
MVRLGIDIGSRQVKFVLDAGEGQFRRFSLPTFRLYHDHSRGQEDGTHVLDLSSLDLPFLDEVAATGYGRHNVKLPGVLVVSEIEAHAWGAAAGHPGEFCLLDLGGQDTKTVRVRDGHVEDFVVNDKCAAGSGRYLENMAQVMGVDLETLFSYYLDPADLSTTCAVYAESEIVGKVADGVPLARLCAGVNHSVFLRLRPMLERWPLKQLVFVGGGARNQALVYYLRQAGFQVNVPAHPEYNGANGCLALLAKERT